MLSVIGGRDAGKGPLDHGGQLRGGEGQGHDTDSVGCPPPHLYLEGLTTCDKFRVSRAVVDLYRELFITLISLSFQHWSCLHCLAICVPACFLLISSQFLYYSTGDKLNRSSALPSRMWVLNMMRVGTTYIPSGARQDSQVRDFLSVRIQVSLSLCLPAPLVMCRWTCK